MHRLALGQAPEGRRKTVLHVLIHPLSLSLGIRLLARSGAANKGALHPRRAQHAVHDFHGLLRMGCSPYT
eukprot:515687-Prymnesium_polylepis.1